MRSWKNLSVFLVVTYLIIPDMVEANAGFPAIMAVFPFMVFAWLPVVIIETGVYRSAFRCGKPAFKASCFANIWSTMPGVPFGWLIISAILFGFSYFLAPYIDMNDGYVRTIYSVLILSVYIDPMMIPGDNAWLFPAALIVGMLPAFYASVYVERKVVKRYFKDID